MDEQGTSKAGNGSVGYAKKHQNLIDGIVRNLKFLGEDGSILTAGNSGKVPPGQIFKLNCCLAQGRRGNSPA